MSGEESSVLVGGDANSPSERQQLELLQQGRLQPAMASSVPVTVAESTSTNATASKLDNKGQDSGVTSPSTVGHGDGAVLAQSGNGNGTGTANSGHNNGHGRGHRCANCPNRNRNHTHNPGHCDEGSGGKSGECRCQGRCAQLHSKLQPKDEDVKDIITAAKLGVLSKVVQFCEESPESVNMKDPADSATPLHWASYNAHFDVVKFLVSRGADLEASTTSDKRTPLHWAIVGGNLGVVSYLIKQGSDVSRLDSRGYNPLHIAVQHGSDKCVFYFTLMGISIDARDSEGHTPLHWAAYEGNDIALRFLINHGANLNHLDSSGKTPLHWAAIKGNLFCCRILLSEGADPHHQDNTSSTPLVYAFEKKFFPIARLLRMAMRKSLFKKNLERLNPLWVFLGLSSVTVSTFLIATLPLLLAIFIIFVFTMVIVGVTPHRCPLEGMSQKNPLWLCIFCSGLATSAFIYFHTLIHELGVVSNLLFIAANFAMMYAYYFMATGDPGFLPQNTITLAKLEELISTDELSKKDICLHCSTLRPLRSRHCFTCDRCVSRFDHHCAWVNNCVGFKNHRVFHFLTFMTTMLHVVFILMCMSYIYHSCYPDILRVFSLDTLRIILREKLILWTILFHLGFFSWEFQVAFFQTWCVLRNVTLNEHFNWQKIPWLQSASGTFRNPFAHGMTRNLVEFYTSSVDYSNIFSIENPTALAEIV